MLKERAKLIAYWVWTTDLVLTTVAFLLAWWLRSHFGPQLLPRFFPTELYPLSRYLGLLPLVLAIWTFLLVTREAYTSRRTVALYQEVWEVVQVVGIGTLTLAAAGWLLRLDFVSRPFLVLFACLTVIHGLRTVVSESQLFEQLPEFYLMISCESCTVNRLASQSSDLAADYFYQLSHSHTRWYRMWGEYQVRYYAVCCERHVFLRNYETYDSFLTVS